MEKTILEELKSEVTKMKVQLIVQKTMVDVINNLQIPGAQAAQYAQQKGFLENSLELSKLTVANLQKLIEKEEQTNG